MATRRKNNKKLGRGGRIALAVVAALLLVILALCGYGAVNASLVSVRRAEVELFDLPQSFDGTTLLYASDIDLCGINDAKKSGALFEKLQSLRPDILILGGDYNSDSLLRVLNRSENQPDSTAAQLRERTDFFQYIGAFDAPLGKYAIAAPEDAQQEVLARQMIDAGVRPLFNDRADIHIGNDTLWITGVSAESANLNSAGRVFKKGDCVIVAAYSPVVLPVLLTSEAENGGQWADLALAGHTHGGQIRLFGWSVLQLNRQEQQYLSGWTMENGLPILTTVGVGCEGVNLRLGTAPEVWLITLRRAER